MNNIIKNYQEYTHSETEKVVSHHIYNYFAAIHDFWMIRAGNDYIFRNILRDTKNPGDQSRIVIISEVVNQWNNKDKAMEFYNERLKFYDDHIREISSVLVSFAFNVHIPTDQLQHYQSEKRSISFGDFLPTGKFFATTFYMANIIADYDGIIHNLYLSQTHDEAGDRYTIESDFYAIGEGQDIINMDDRDEAVKYFQELLEKCDKNYNKIRASLDKLKYGGKASILDILAE